MYDAIIPKRVVYYCHYVDRKFNNQQDKERKPQNILQTEVYSISYVYIRIHTVSADKLLPVVWLYLTITRGAIYPHRLISIPE